MTDDANQRGLFIQPIPKSPDPIRCHLACLQEHLIILHATFHAFFESSCVAEELIGLHLLVIDHPMGCTDLWAFILIEEILPENQLNFSELVNPYLLRKIAERAVEFMAWE